jgi:hypothetical protein
MVWGVDLAIESFYLRAGLSSARRFNVRFRPSRRNHKYRYIRLVSKCLTNNNLDVQYDLQYCTALLSHVSRVDTSPTPHASILLLCAFMTLLSSRTVQKYHLLSMSAYRWIRTRCECSTAHCMQRYGRVSRSDNRTNIIAHIEGLLTQSLSRTIRRKGTVNTLE